MSKSNKKQENIFIIPDNIVLWDEEYEGAYTEEALELVMDFLNDVAERHSIEYSSWGLNFKDRTIDMNQVPYPDMKELHYDGGWGDSGNVVFKKAPTYLQLWKASEKLIKKSRDEHHSFIENFVTHDVSGIYHLQTGS